MKTHLTLDPSPQSFRTGTTRRGKLSADQTPYERLSQRLADWAKRDGHRFEEERIQRLRVAMWGEAAL
jgi:hypothetical protein